MAVGYIHFFVKEKRPAISYINTILPLEQEKYNFFNGNFCIQCIK